MEPCRRHKEGRGEKRRWNCVVLVYGPTYVIERATLWEAPPPTPAHSRVPRRRLIARYKFASLKMEEEEETRDRLFIPLFRVSIAQRNRHFFDAFHSRRHTTTFSTAAWLNVCFFHVGKTAAQRKTFIE